jgi:hypothetical protein
LTGPSTNKSDPLPLIIGLISTATVIIGVIVIIKMKVMKEKKLIKVNCTEMNTLTVEVKSKLPDLIGSRKSRIKVSPYDGMEVVRSNSCSD